MSMNIVKILAVGAGVTAVAAAGLSVFLKKAGESISNGPMAQDTIMSMEEENKKR
jgi:hypothetical protein